MNWLAHVLLSEPDIRFQLGNLLADVMKGTSREGMSEAFRRGRSLHRAIDAFTESHPVFVQSKQRLGSRGRLRGVVDLVYDHMLARNWPRFSSVDLRGFVDGFYDAACTEIQTYPPEARRFLKTVVERDRLGLYAEPEELARALERIDLRLPETLKGRESAVAYFPRVMEKHREFESDFMMFFPEVISFVSGRANVSITRHG
jgi:acyl carrier protein phosphodiesterase